MLRDLDGASRSDVYRLMTQVVVPRPIAWVLTDAGDDVPAAERWNLAPFSYFTALASQPALIGYSIGTRGDGTAKDTLQNVRARSAHTVLLPHRGLVEAVQRTSLELPHGRSEVRDAGLTPLDWDWPTPRIAGVRVALGCHLERSVDLAPDGQVLVIARVHRVWLDDAVAREDRPGSQLIDPVALDPLGRLGTGLYAGIDRPVRPPGEAGPGPT